MKRIKTITSYAGHARFLAECGSKTMWMASKHMPVKTPFYSGPTVSVIEWNGMLVKVAETSHKRYEVWQVPSNLVRQTESEAMKEQFA
jgi:hypothetical protein